MASQIPKHGTTGGQNRSSTPNIAQYGADVEIYPSMTYRIYWSIRNTPLFTDSNI
jgi:hypothetical protein